MKTFIDGWEVEVDEHISNFCMIRFGDYSATLDFLIDYGVLLSKSCNEISVNRQTINRIQQWVSTNNF